MVWLLVVGMERRVLLCDLRDRRKGGAGIGGIRRGIEVVGVRIRVGMRAPSLYSYFDSKHAIYDAMFLQGNLDLLARYVQRLMETK